MAPSPPGSTSSATRSPNFVPSFREKVRQDGSPVQPLSSILNVSRIMASPHTSAQISALWTAYHASRSNGTGRGYVCATIPLDLYQKMTAVASKYPTFVIPLPRPKDPIVPVAESRDEIPHEFYFMEWASHEPPPQPSAYDPDPLGLPLSSPPPGPSPNPAVTTILFTSLQEYKMRNSFATPYLVLTHYTDLAQSHGIVLLRGEITPTTANGAGGDARYFLSQEDAQLLAMGVQRYYLWGHGDGEGERLLRTFHEKPQEFKWEDLLKPPSL